MTLRGFCGTILEVRWNEGANNGCEQVEDGEAETTQLRIVVKNLCFRSAAVLLPGVELRN